VRTRVEVFWKFAGLADGFCKLGDLIGRFEYLLNNFIENSSVFSWFDYGVNACDEGCEHGFNSYDEGCNSYDEGCNSYDEGCNSYDEGCEYGVNSYDEGCEYGVNSYDEGCEYGVNSYDEGCEYGVNSQDEGCEYGFDAHGRISNHFSMV
jgi:hypothetical protein